MFLFEVSQPPRKPRLALDFFSDRSHGRAARSSLGSQQRLDRMRGFAAESRRDFFMAGFDAIGSCSNFFPWTGAWYSLMCQMSSSCCCSVEWHGEAAMTRRQPARAAALRAAAISPLWPSLDLTTLAWCHPASAADVLRGPGLLTACCCSTVVSKPRVLVRNRRGWRMSLTSPLVRAV